jgi:hypothetical protein
MPDGTLDPPPHAGLRVPSLFFGLHDTPEVVADLQALIRRLGDVTDPFGAWFIADNLITFGHTRGFLTDPRFVAAVVAARAQPLERAIAWRTHTLCWAAESCLALEGDFVECGSYQGYSMEVLLRYLHGLPDRRLWLYDLFDPSGGSGEGRRLPAHSPALFEQVRARFAAWPNVTVTRGKVPDVLATVAPERIAFLHVDMNNADAERGALEVLFGRLATGGIVLFDDYGWTGYRDQKAAADDFAAGHGLAVLELPTGQGMLLKR